MTDTLEMVPAVPEVRIAANSEPYLEGARCTACGQAFLNAPTACPKCYARDGIEPLRLDPRGKVYSYTIVSRSFPGVKTPFAMVVVDMVDGLAMRATLVDVDPVPEAITFDMPVRLEFRDSGQRNADGQPYLSYVFVPDKGATP